MGIWECHDLSELKEFLGITIRCSGRKIILDQKAYLTKVLDRFGMTNTIERQVCDEHQKCERLWSELYNRALQTPQTPNNTLNN